MIGYSGGSAQGSFRKPYIVGLGGTARPNSSSEQALAMALGHAASLGAATAMFCGSDLMLPLYAPEGAELDANAQRLVDGLRRADGVILSSPCYHGAVSGLVKNALDYTEEMRNDPRVYFDGLAIGCIGCGYGSQGPVMVLAQLRCIAHALRGWPAPLGVAINSALVKFDHGRCSDVASQLAVMAVQVLDHAARRVATNPTS